MPIIGFIALLGIGAFLLIAGVAWAVASRGLTGHADTPSLVFVVVGFVILCFTVYNAPFNITWTVS